MYTNVIFIIPPHICTACIAYYLKPYLYSSAAVVRLACLSVYVVWVKGGDKATIHTLFNIDLPYHCATLLAPDVEAAQLLALFAIAALAKHREAAEEYFLARWDGSRRSTLRYSSTRSFFNIYLPFPPHTPFIYQHTYSPIFIHHFLPHTLH